MNELLTGRIASRDKTVDPWVCGLTLAGIFGWILSFPLYGPVTAALFTSSASLLGHIFAASHGVTLLLLGWYKHLTGRICREEVIRWTGVTLAVLTVIGTLSTGLFLPMQYALFACFGVLSAYLVICWTPWFTYQTKPAMSLAIVIVGSNIILFLGARLVQGGAPFLWAFIGLLAAVVLVSVGPLSKRVDELNADAHTARESAEPLRGTIISLVAFALAAYVGGAIMYQVMMPVVAGIWAAGIDAGLFLYCLSTVLLAPAAQRYGPPVLSGFALSSLGLGLLLSTSTYGSQGFVGAYMLVMIGEGGADMFYWLSLWMLSLQAGSFRAFGLGLGGSVLIMAAAGTLVQYAPLDNAVRSPVAGMVGTALLFVAIPFIFHNSTLRRQSLTKIRPSHEQPPNLPAADAPLPLSESLSDSFTAAEQKVFELLITGATDPEMAETLSVSRHTIKFHVRNILRKAEVKNRTELLAILLQNSDMDNGLNDSD